MAIDDAMLDEATQGSFDDTADLENADFGNDHGAGEAEAAAEAGESEGTATGDVEGAGEAEATEDGSGGEQAAAAEGDGSEGEAAVDEGESAPKREPMLPKSRYDSVRRRLREAEAKLEEQAKQDAENPPEPDAPRDFDAEIGVLNKQFTQALLDADAEKSAELNQQMMALQAERTQAMFESSRTDVISAAHDATLTNTLVDELVAENARLNPDSDSFDQTLVTRMNNMRRFFEDTDGLTESQALVKTVETLMPEVFEQTPTDTKAAKKLADKIEAAGKQPPNANSTGEDAPAYGQGQVLDPMKLTLDDLDKVTDEQWDDMLGNNFG